MRLKLKSRLVVLLAEKKYVELRAAAAELTDPEYARPGFPRRTCPRASRKRREPLWKRGRLRARLPVSLREHRVAKRARRKNVAGLAQASDRLAGRRQERRPNRGPMAQGAARRRDAAAAQNCRPVARSQRQSRRLVRAGGERPRRTRADARIGGRLNAWQTGNQAFVNATLAAMCVRMR